MWQVAGAGWIWSLQIPCNDWPGESAAHLSHIFIIQKIPRAFISHFCHTENPQRLRSGTWPQAALKHRSAQVTHSLSQQQLEHQSDLFGAAKVTPGCPQGPELPAGHNASVVPRQEPWRDQSRTGSISLLFSKAARGA